MRKILLILALLLLTNATASAQSAQGAGPSSTQNTNAQGFVSNGTKFVTTGTCVFTSPLGGATAGKMTTSTVGTCSFGINLPTAPNGWTCDANDETSGARINTLTENTTSATFSGTTAASDVVNFNCIGF